MATYTAEAYRAGINVRVEVTLEPEAEYADVDELGEVVGLQAGSLLHRLLPVKPPF